MILNIKYISLKVYFKYTSEFENRYINLESPLEVCFRVRKYKYISKTGSKHT